MLIDASRANGHDASTWPVTQCRSAVTQNRCGISADMTQMTQMTVLPGWAQSFNFRQRGNDEFDLYY